MGNQLETGKIHVWGSKFKDIDHLISFYKLDRNTFLAVYGYNEISIEEAIEICLKNKNNKYVVFGKPFKSIRMIAEYHNISEESILYRHKRLGMSLEDAVTHAKENYDPRNFHSKQIFCDGVQYTSLTKFANAFGLDYKDVLEYNLKGVPADVIVRVAKKSKKSKK